MLFFSSVPPLNVMKYHPFLFKHLIHLPNPTSSVCIHLGSTSWASNKVKSFPSLSALLCPSSPSPCSESPLPHCLLQRPSHPSLPHCLAVILQWCKAVNGPQHPLLYSKAAPKAQTFLSWSAGSPLFSAMQFSLRLRCSAAPQVLQKGRTGCASPLRGPGHEERSKEGLMLSWMLLLLAWASFVWCPQIKRFWRSVTWNVNGKSSEVQWRCRDSPWRTYRFPGAAGAGQQSLKTMPRETGEGKEQESGGDRCKKYVTKKTAVLGRQE